MQPATIKFKVKFAVGIPSPFDGVLAGGEINPKSLWFADEGR
jgi:hypothetical protein